MSSLTDSTGFSFGLGVAGRLPSLIPWGAVDFLAPSFPARPPSLGFGFSESPSGNACCASGSTALFFAMSCERFMSIRFLFSQSDHPATQGSDEIGRAHVCTPVTNAHLVCRILLQKKKYIIFSKLLNHSFTPY